MTCAHIGEVENRLVAATLMRSQPYRSSKAMVADVTKGVKQCLHCVDWRARERLPRSYSDTVHGTSPNDVVHFDFLKMGDSGPIGATRWPEDSQVGYIFVIKNDLTNHV